MRVRSGSKKDYSMVRIFFRMIREMFRMIPLESCIYCILDILHAGSTVLAVFLMQRFFDSISQLTSGGSFRYVVGTLILFGVGNVANEICNGLANFKTEFLPPKVISGMNRKLHEKIAEVDASEFEDPAFLDYINKARQGIESGFLASLFALTIVTFYLPYYLFMAWYLKELSPSLVPLLLVIFIPVLLGQLIRFRIFKDVEDDIAADRRAMEYYEAVICGRESFKETRLLGAYQYFINLFRGKRDLINKKVIDAEIRNARMEFVLRIITIGGYIGILAILVHELLAGKISAGGFAAVFSSVGIMYGLAEEVFGGVMRYISRNAVSIVNYQKFVDLPIKKTYIQKSDFVPEAEIYLKDVHFRYPGAAKDAVKGVTLSISAGETVAIVGENGSGKSTLVKLIMGLYKPSSGKIFVGGEEVADDNRDTVREKFSAVFQKFQRYSLTLKENVTISDERRRMEGDDDICTACADVDLQIDEKTFPEGIDTVLSREFGGAELSGGQWQRVAAARGLFRRSKIIILDEPTSAIDPLEEAKVYRQFARLSQGKTSIIVTHRIGAAGIADRIIVLKDGMVDDVGSHRELMQRNGFYAFLYKEQAKWYRK